MITERFHSAVLLLALLPLGSGAAGAGAALGSAPDETLRDTDHRKLGKQVAEWFEAKDQSKGIDKAYLEITSSVEKIEKKLKGVNALALVEDWEAIFYEARVESLGNDIKVRKGRPHEASAALPNGSESEFAVYVPGNYSSKKGPYPLVLVVPDQGMSPLTLLEEQWIDEDLRANAILLSPVMPENTESWSKIAADNGGPGGIGTLMSLYGQVLQQFPIDMDRVYLVGYGAGGSTVGRAAGLYPHLFAAVVLVDSAAAVDATNFRSLPLLAVGESSVPKAVEELGYENCASMEVADPGQIWSWVVDKTRDPYPQEIIFVPQSPYTTSAHWLSLEGVDVEAGPRVQARIERASNSIFVDAEKVTTIKVFFNDVLVDMDKPVNVVINGTPHETSVARNKRLMLELNYNLGDWGRVFTNRLSFDVPAEKSK